MNSQSHYVMKFGGSCLASAGDMANAASIVSKYRNCVVVASAVKGVTQRLIELSDVKEEKQVQSMVLELKKVHIDMLSELESRFSREDAERELEYFFEILESILLETRNVRSSPDRAHILSFGERLSATILRWYIKDRGLKAVTINSDEIIFSENDEYLDASVDEEISLSEIRSRISFHYEQSEIPVVTGFFCSSLSGMTALLGRNSSDYTAALIAFSLPTYELVFWKDVPGLMTGDPKVVKESHVLKLLTYEQANRYIVGGSRILHPKVLELAERKGTAIRIRNFRNPESEGTLITAVIPSIEIV